MTASLPFDNQYQRLPDRFYRRVHPTPVANPRLVIINRVLAMELNIDPGWLAGPEGLSMLAGNQVVAGSDPLAMVYAGHQFGAWVPQLGDGRAVLLGELVDRTGQRRDVQLKGSGPTPYSRAGDGRASIGPVVREYLASEAMAALGIPTTRALAIVQTGETVQRDKPEPGGILCRVAASHVRIGTFEYFSSRGRSDDVRRLADHLIDRMYRQCRGAARPYQAMLELVIQRTIELVAAWMSVGFIHGVMNTDNMALSGETLDFGPFGFLDAFIPDQAFSYIDRRGRYAWSRQPGIAQWNLARLAECLLPLLDASSDLAVEIANDLISAFPARFEKAYTRAMTAKIGLSGEHAQHRELAVDLLDRMAVHRVDFTLLFRRLCALDGSDEGLDGPVMELFEDPGAFQSWAESWRAALAGEARDEAARKRAMRAVNPAFVLRNHLAQQAADAAVERLDFGPMERLLVVLSRPYHDQPQALDLQRPPRPEQVVANTFCGT